MTDREGLLKAIAAQPDEDTPRLALADWLDENGTTDQDAARAEYIRLSCGVGYGGDRMRTKVRLGVKEGKWLDANWKRLVPGLVSCATPEHQEIVFRHPNESRNQYRQVGGVKFTRSGRKLVMSICWEWDSGQRDMMSRHSGVTITLWFWRGFVQRFDVYGLRQLYLLGGIIVADEPLAEPRIENRPLNFTRVGGVLASIDSRWDRCSELLSYIKTHDRTTPRENAGDGFTAKHFDRRDGEDEESLYKRAYASIDDAALGWIHFNRGRSFLLRHDDVELVSLPVDLATPHPLFDRRIQ